MSIYIKLQDRLIAVSTVSLEYNNYSRAHKVMIKSTDNRRLRLVATEKEPLKLSVIQALRDKLLSSIQNKVTTIDITNQVAQANKLYHEKDAQGYINNFFEQPKVRDLSEKRASAVGKAPVNPNTGSNPLILVSESVTPTENKIFIHVLEGKTGVKVYQYNTSSTGNIFNIILSNKNLSLSSNNTLPILKFEIDPKEIDLLTFKYRNLDGVRKAFDTKVKQATQELMNNLPQNGIITPQFLLNYYQGVLPRFTRQDIVILKQT